MGHPKILLADDHTLILDALTKFIDPQFEIIGAVSDGKELMLAAAKLRPDVVLLDINMPELSGMDAGPQLKKLLPQTKLIVLTMSEDTDLAHEALRHWASGYLLKESAGFELNKAIHEVLRGRSYVTPKVAKRLEEDFIRDPNREHRRTLTSRQREVLQLLAEGKTMKETAEVLHVTPRTIAFHKYRIMEDFGLRSNSDLVRFALRSNIIHPL